MNQRVVAKLGIIKSLALNEIGISNLSTPDL